MQRERTITVAVIDDDVSLCKALRRLLSAWRMKAVTYPSAEAFLEDEHRPSLDCLILDVQLGGMSGLDLLDALRERNLSVPTVVITAHDVAETRERALKAGAAYVRKAEPGAVLQAAILRAIGPAGERERV